MIFLGTTLSISAFAIPALLQNPSSAILLAQWSKLFNLGKRAAPPVALVSALSYYATGYLQYSHFLPWKASVVSGALTMGIIPYTLIFMKKTNARLIEMSASVTEEKEEVVKGEARELVDRWGLLNAIRSVLPLAAAILAGYNSVVAV